MALFMEVHTIHGGVSLEDVAKAHVADLAIQGGHGVRYLRYWVDEQDGKVFRLVEAPSGEAAASVHRQPHGQVADEFYQVREGLWPGSATPAAHGQPDSTRQPNDLVPPTKVRLANAA